MKELLKKLTDRFAAVSEDMKKLIEATAETNMTEEQSKQFDVLSKESDELTAKIEKTEKAIKADMENSRFRTRPAKVESATIGQPEAIQKNEPEFKIPATVKKCGNLKAFKNDERMAYSFGQWVRAANGIGSAREWCNNNGVMLAVHNEGTNSTGGYLVPQQFDNALIDLRLQYGVFRRNARVRPMSSDVLMIPRRASGLTAYWVGESTAITESTKSWDQVQLTAKKLAVLTRMSNELSEDAIISVADDLANEIAYQFAYAEDTAGFVGTGLATHGHITGVSLALNRAAGTPTTTSAGGVQVGTGNLFSELAIGDFTSTVGRCPSYARMGAKWYCSPIFYDTVMARLAFAAGGINPTEMVNGVPRNIFLGYPVELVEVMPSTDANSQIVALFGNLALAASLGDRRQTTLAFSDSAYVGTTSVFESDQIAVRGTERLDIVVHEVGTTSTAGAIVGLQSLNA